VYDAKLTRDEVGVYGARDLRLGGTDTRMVKIRLMRLGAKKNPHYRVVVVDARTKRSGDYIESLGHYDPRDTTPAPLKVDNERAAYWLSQGAQPTDTVLRLFQKVGVEVPSVLAKRRAAYTKRTEAAA
jgi:small subunit ribosomal protein S16